VLDHRTVPRPPPVPRQRLPAQRHWWVLSSSVSDSPPSTADLVTVLVRATKPFDADPSSPLVMSAYDYQAFTNRSLLPCLSAAHSS
jgi:hypothetical protein